jgi:uncharacterized protein YggU (UPF0235/DUF167 family)
MKKWIKVKPNATVRRLDTEPDGSLTAYLQSSPVDGKANAELIRLLAQVYRIPRSAISIKIGQTARRKLVEMDAEEMD